MPPRKRRPLDGARGFGGREPPEIFLLIPLVCLIFAVNLNIMPSARRLQNHILITAHLCFVRECKVSESLLDNSLWTDGQRLMSITHKLGYVGFTLSFTQITFTFSSIFEFSISVFPIYVEMARPGHRERLRQTHSAEIEVQDCKYKSFFGVGDSFSISVISWVRQTRTAVSRRVSRPPISIHHHPLHFSIHCGLRVCNGRGIDSCVEPCYQAVTRMLPPTPKTTPNPTC